MSNYNWAPSTWGRKLYLKNTIFSCLLLDVSSTSENSAPSLITMAHDISADRRLLLVSSRARNKAAMVAAALPGVSLVEYSYDSSTLDDLREAVDKVLGAEQKVSSVALVLHGSEKELFLCQASRQYPNVRYIRLCLCNYVLTSLYIKRRVYVRVSVCLSAADVRG